SLNAHAATIRDWGQRARRCLFLGHPGLDQTSEIDGFEQGADLWHAKGAHGPQPGDARIAIIAAQPASKGKFGARAFDLATVSMGGSEVGMWKHMFRICATRSLEPENCFFNVRLQQMGLSSPVIV